MLVKKIAYLLMGIGIFIIFIMLIADFIGLGSNGIQSAQLLGIEVGIVVVIFGYWLLLSTSENPYLVMEWRTRISRFFSSPVVAVLVGVLIAYFVFSLVPMLLNSELRFQYFNRYLPDKSPIGFDLQTLLDRVETWFKIKTPYPGNILQFYPPLTYAFFSPLTMVNYRMAYLIMTLVTLVSYVLLTLLLPIKMNPKGRHSIVLFLFAMSLFSYGLQFELERGQYNVLTILFCMLAIYIYHYHHKFRYIAYFLFSIAVQLKLFPAIFILMFVTDWRNWKGNVTRFVGIGLFNIALLFILGYRVFLDFIHAITEQIMTPYWDWNGNHSIHAFVFNLMKDGYGLIQPSTLASLNKYSSMISVLLLTIFALCLFLLLLFSYRYNETGLNSYLLLVCTIGALIIPTSNDYTLSFLTAPVAIFLAGITIEDTSKTKYLASVLILIISFSFSSTLFPFKYKPYFLNNNFPALFIILISVIALYFLRDRSRQAKIVEGE